MATVTPIYFNPRFSFRRAYLTGFVGSVGVTNMTIVGSFLEFDYLFPLIHCSLKLESVFQPPSSNNYTLDHVFDFASSVVTISGVPADVGVGVKFVAMATEQTWRIQVLATLAIDESQRVDLIPLSGYWRAG